MRSPRPILLLADSQLLFSSTDNIVVRARDALGLDPADITAAYLGASNGDEPAFYSLFVASMETIGVTSCCHVHAIPTAIERAFLETAHVIGLAGGDPWLGWRAFEAAGLVDLVRARYAAGAQLIGVSAGAMQLGTYVGRATEQGITPVATFGLVPFLVGAHAEATGWAELKALVHATGGVSSAIGIPTGGGVVVHRDASVEPVRHPVFRYSATKT